MRVTYRLLSTGSRAKLFETCTIFADVVHHQVYYSLLPVHCCDCFVILIPCYYIEAQMLALEAIAGTANRA